jgi:hypothetical protein
VADLTFGQLETLWIQAGGSKATAPIAAAIALAESSGNPDAVNPNDNHGTQSSFGLWQISNGTHNPPSPNWQNPRVNAALAVAKYKAAGGWGPWGTYPEPALKILAQHTGQQPSTLPGTVQGGGGPGGGTSGGTGQAGLAADVATGGGFGLNPISDIASIWDQLGRLISGGVPIVSSVEQLSKDFNALVKLGATFLHDIEWLFVPSHWIRIIAFAFGSGTMLAGAWALMHAGRTGGDLSLALGIGLVTFAGVLLFIAFHNLDPSIKDLSGLLGAMSDAITGKGNKLNPQAAG